MMETVGSFFTPVAMLFLFEEDLAVREAGGDVLYALEHYHAETLTDLDD